LCQNRPCSGICDDIQIRSARVSIRIGFREMFATCSSPLLVVLVEFLVFTVSICLDLLL
jgi:hypothetical protein